MKKNIYIIIIIVISFLAASCSKNRPETGRYGFYVKYEGYPASEKWTEIHITESSKNYILLSYNDKLDKKGKKLTGVIFPFGRSMYLDGEWSHGLFKKNSSIKGTFKEKMNSGIPQYFAYGTFEMIPF